jgi:AcrR family transcriptional regulator
MPRNGERVHRRLQGAALELFLERGYDQTTNAEIAARAGVSERTFYRHFPDKRETLFDGEATMRSTLVDAVISAPAELPAMRVLLLAFGAVEPMLNENRAFAEPRQAVISATPALRERELSKAAGMITELSAALVQKGVEVRLAMLATQAGMAAFDQAVKSWVADPSRALDSHLAEAFDDLHALSLASARSAHEP